MSDHGNPDAVVPAMDFIEFISQDLPWDEIDRALGDYRPPHDRSPVPAARPTVTRSPYYGELRADDLSLFSAFASSLPCLGPHAEPDTDIKAIQPSLGLAVCAATGLDVDAGLEEAVGTSSATEDIKRDIRDGAVGDGLHAASYSDGEQLYDGSPDRNTLQSADSDVAEKSKLTERCGVSGESDCTKKDDNCVVPCRGEVVPDSASSSELRNERGFCDDTGNQQESGDDDDSEDDDDDDMTDDSQRWVRDQLKVHITQQHDEASRLNGLRNIGRPATVPRDTTSRALHMLSTQVELIKLDMQLTDALQADSPDTSHCSRPVFENACFTVFRIPKNALFTFFFQTDMSESHKSRQQKSSPQSFEISSQLF